MIRHISFPDLAILESGGKILGFKLYFYTLSPFMHIGTAYNFPSTAAFLCTARCLMSLSCQFKRSEMLGVLIAI